MKTLVVRFRFLVNVFPFIILIAFWFALFFTDALRGVDFYPLYFAATRIRDGLSPYGQDATFALMQNWDAPFASAGIAYPFPFLLLIVPFTFAPFPYAAWMWEFLGGISSIFVLKLGKAWRHSFPLLFLFLPFYRSISLGQATLIWFGLSALLLHGIYSRRPWLVGIVVVLLLLKPQNGLFFAVAGILWGWAEERQTLWWFLGTALIIGCIAFGIRPGWLSEWIAQIQLYATIVTPQSLLPAGLLVLAACWRLPWWARVAVAQVVLFPLSDMYSALPLLFCWIAIDGPLALVGAGLSWLWLIGGFPNTVTMLWIFILVPLIVCALLRTWIGAPFETKNDVAVSDS